MDLKEIKKLVNYARRAGVKSLSYEGLSVEFKDEILIQHPRKAKLKAVVDEKMTPAPDPLPTLDDINKFIYGTTEEAG